jgi:hypothetical protein
MIECSSNVIDLFIFVIYDVQLSRAWRTTRTKAKERFKYNFQIRNQIRLCDSKTGSLELTIRTQYM